jgi:uncharacterized small protein (DUF1192 family)
MALESFNWKSIFINDENAKTTKQENSAPSHAAETKFPSATNETKFPETTFTATTSGNSTNNPFLNEILDVYNKGFESLNSEGFDFFEMYKSVMAVGPTNPQSYQMAFTMGKTIKSDLSKAFLLEKSKFYITEIEKVYSKYDATGNSKNKDLNNTITAQKQNLTKSITDLESQIAKLQAELETKKAELARIDNDNSEMFAQIQLKIEANNIAKQKILESINTVVTGINQYL